MTTTSYGTWNTRVDSNTLNVGQWIINALDGANLTEFDIVAIENGVRAEIDSLLPHGLSLCGDEFIGPADGLDTADELNLAAIVDGIDFWQIVQRHELATVTLAVVPSGDISHVTHSDLAEVADVDEFNTPQVRAWIDSHDVDNRDDLYVAVVLGEHWHGDLAAFPALDVRIPSTVRDRLADDVA